MTQWYLKYRVYTDKGMALNRNRQIIHRGPEYDEDHFMPGITVGENCMMIGGWGGTPVWRDDGVFLLPVQTTIPGENGGFYNPGAGYTWTDSHVLFGETQIDGTIIWSISEPVKGDPETTTRGMVEPTIAKLNNGSILMVMRGSNDAEPELPGYKWASWSRDGGVTWSEPQPWTYSDGSDFYSPSSMSQLLEWGDGRLFWAGNISEDNPRGNHPRFPLVMAEVDRETGLLKHDTLAVIADREDDESEYLQYSNFYCRENRETGLMDVFVTPLFARDFRRDGASPDFTSDAVVIHVKVL
jgi:hypothetical protein